MLHIGNGLLITFNSKNEVIEKGGVVFAGEEIKAVGPTEALKQEYPGADFRDVRGRVIMPGMINTHTHLYSTFARGMDLKTDRPPGNFTEILEKLWWRLDNTLNEDDIYYSALYGLLDCITRGTTTIFDHHASYNCIEGSLNIIAEAVEKTGLRANLCFEISDRHGREKARKAIRENERFLRRLSRQNLEGERSGRLGGMIGLHASFTLEEETLSEVSALSEEYEVPFHIHTAEGKADVLDSKKRGYKGVVDRLNQFNIWQQDSLAIHGVHLTAEELALLADRNTFLIHNPESNMGNAVGSIAVDKVLASGVTLGLGTDGYTADMFESLKAAGLLQKHDSGHPQAGGSEIFTAAFRNNPAIAGRFFSGEYGVLKTGVPADIIVIDYIPPTPLTGDNFLYHLYFGAQGGLVDTTIVNGKILMEKGEVKILDYEKIGRKIKRQAGDFWQRF